MKNNPDSCKDDTIILDMKRHYVAVCQAAEKLVTQAESLKEPHLTKYVTLLEKESLVIPSSLCRQITTLKARDALRSWATADSSSQHIWLDAWMQISLPWLTSTDKCEAWDILVPRMRDCPPSSEPSDVDCFVKQWAGCMLNDTLNLIVKDDGSHKNLMPVTDLAGAFLARRETDLAESSKWRRQADEKLLLVIENVSAAYRGFCGMLSPVPLVFGCKPSDVEYTLPKDACDQAVSRRKSGEEPPASMGDINQAGKVIQNNIAGSKVWRQLRSEYEATKAVDLELGPIMVKALATLDEISCSTMDDAAQKTMAQAIKTLDALRSGSKALRPGGAKPLETRLQSIITQLITDVLDEEVSEDSSEVELMLEELSWSMSLAAHVGGLDDVLTKATAFKTSTQGKNVTSTLAALLNVRTHDKIHATQLLQALRAVTKEDLGPAVGKQLLLVQVGFFKSQCDELPVLGTSATANSLDAYCLVNTEIGNHSSAKQVAGDTEKTNLILLGIPQKILSLVLAANSLEKKASERLPVLDGLRSLVAAHDVFRKLSVKFSSSTTSAAVQADETLLSIAVDFLARVPAFIGSNAASFIAEIGTAELRISAANMERRASELSPAARGHPNRDGQSWFKGLARNADFDETFKHAQSTLIKIDYGPELEGAVPVVSQVARPEVDSVLVRPSACAAHGKQSFSIGLANLHVFRPS
jgi:hypothetical protein